MELIFYRKLLSLFGGLFIIIDLANAGMVPIGHPNNAKGNRPPFGKPIASPGINTNPSVTVHGRPDNRPGGANSGYGPQPAMSFGISQHKPPHPSSAGSSQSSVGNSQSHFIYTQNTAGAGADPVMIVASTQNALNETENTHTVPMEQMASIFSTALAASQEESNPETSQAPDPQTQSQIADNHVENPHQNEVQTIPEIAPENSPGIPNPANQNNAVHIETPILSVATDATQTAENLQLAGQETLAAHIPSDIESSQNEILVANNSPENIPLSEVIVVTEVGAQPPSSSLNANSAITVSQEVIPDAVPNPSSVQDDHEHHFDLEAYLAQANMVLGTSDSNTQPQPVQSINVVHPSENMEANVMVPSDPQTPSILVPETSDPPPSSMPASEASDPPPSSISVPVPETSDPPPSPVSKPVSVSPTSPVSKPVASVSPTSPVSVPNASAAPSSPIQVPEVVQEPVPEILQLAEPPSIEIQEAIPASAEIEISQNEITVPHIAPESSHVSEVNLSNVIPEVLSDQAILSMPNEVFEESVLNIEIAHENTVAQSQSNNHESDAGQLADNIMADVSPIAPITVDHNEHVPIPSNPEVSVSSLEETLSLLSEASQVTPDIPVQLEEAQEINTVVEASSTQAEGALTNHTPLNADAQNIYSSPVESESTNVTDDDDDDPPFNVEQYLAQAALLLGSKSYPPYVHDDQQGSANDLYYSDKQNFQQSSEQFGKDKTGTVKANQYYTHFGNKFTSSQGTGREHDSSNLKLEENNDEISNKEESLDTKKSPSSHPSHSASTKPLSGPPFVENFDENILLTMVNPGNENSGVEEESHELPAELERSRPFRPGIARPSSLGMKPMYTYSGGVLNTPLGEDIKLTEYSNIVPAISKNPNATVAAEPVKFPHNSLMPLLGSSSFNSYFNGSHTNISLPNTASSFIMAQAPSVPAPQQVPSMQHAVLNNSNIVTSMNNSQLKPTEFQSYYFPQESVKFANVLINNGGIRPIAGSKNIVESGIFVIPQKSELGTKSMQDDDDFGNLNPGQSVVDLLAQDRKKASGNNHFVKRASASGKSLDKTNNRVSDSVKGDIADSKLQVGSATPEEMEDNEKATASQITPENSVGEIESDNSSVHEDKEASVSDTSPAQGEILNKEEEQKGDDSESELDSHSQQALEQKESDSENESDSQLASEQKGDDDSNTNSGSQSNEKYESDLKGQQETEISINQPESEVETENSEKRKDAFEEDEYEIEEKETQMKDSENGISSVNEQKGPAEVFEENQVTQSENNSHKDAQPKHPDELAPTKSNSQETTKVKQPVKEKEENPPVKAVPSKQSPSKETTPKHSKDTPQKPQAPSTESLPKDPPTKPQAPSTESLPKDPSTKPQAPSKESSPKDPPTKPQAPSTESLPKDPPTKPQAPSAESLPKDPPTKPQAPSTESLPKNPPTKPQATSKDNPPKNPPPKAQDLPPAPQKDSPPKDPAPQKDAGNPASGPGLPPMPSPPDLVAPPEIDSITSQISIPDPIFSIPSPGEFAIPDPGQFEIPSPDQFAIPDPNINTPDISEIIGVVNIPSFPTIGDGSKGSKGIPNSPGKPKPPKKPNNGPSKDSTSKGPSKGSPQSQENSPPDSKPLVNSQTPAILQQEILETVEIHEEPEEMMISQEHVNEEGEEESINLSDENEPQFEEEPSFTNNKALPPKNGRPFPPGFASANPNPMFGNPAFGPGAFPQVTPVSLPGANPDKGCTCNSNSAPASGSSNPVSSSPNNDKENSSGGKPNSNNNAGSPNNDKGNSSGGKPNSNNNAGSPNNDKGNSSGGKPNSNNNAGSSNNDKGNSSSGKHPSVPSKHNPAPTAAPAPAPVIDMDDSEDDSQSNVRPPRPTKPKRPNRPSGGGKKPKPKPSDKNNDKLKDVEVEEDELDPDFLQQTIANGTNIVFTPPIITNSKLPSVPAANNASSSVSQNTPTKQTELFTVYSIFGWEIPVINWAYFSDVFQSFFVEKFRTSSGEFTCDESDNEATILRSELDVDYLCGDDIDYGRRDIRTLADSNICNMFCNSNGYSSGLCMPQKSCLCYMSEKKNFAIKLDRLADFTSNSTEKESSYGEDTCQNCRCLKSCQNNGKYVGYCSKSCHCGVPWYNEDPTITQSSSPQE